jgi:hypothetical protein
MRKALFVFIAFIAVGAATGGALFLLGGPRCLTWEDYDRVKAGEGTLSEADVVAALGRPPDGDIEINWAQRQNDNADYGKIWKQEGFAIEVLFDARHKVVDVDFSGSATPEPVLSKFRRWLRF